MDSARDKILVSDSSFPEASISEAGDVILVRVIQTGESILSVDYFDNLEFEQSLSLDEERMTGN